ncbi:MAG: hypothetical protein IT353_03680, partial [Gemmatimonadaceae bacterium]|nr:hypothetical protein [Gemmatimonadaceae bacterium]
MPPLVHLVCAWIAGAFVGASQLEPLNARGSMIGIAALCGALLGWSRGRDRAWSAGVCLALAVVAAWYARSD